MVTTTVDRIVPHVSPTSWNAKAVATDVADGYISAERACNDYGVVVAADGSVDETATAALRAQLR